MNGIPSIHRDPLVLEHYTTGSRIPKFEPRTLFIDFIPKWVHDPFRKAFLQISFLWCNSELVCYRFTWASLFWVKIKAKNGQVFNIYWTWRSTNQSPRDTYFGSASDTKLSGSSLFSMSHFHTNLVCKCMAVSTKNIFPSTYWHKLEEINQDVFI